VGLVQKLLVIVQGAKRMARTKLPWSLGLLLLAGCLHPVREEADRMVCDLGAHTMDVEPASPPTPAGKLPPADKGPSGVRPKDTTPPGGLEQLPVPQPTQRLPLQVPPEIPGAGARLPDLPLYREETKAQRDKIIDGYYPVLPVLGPNPQPVPGRTGQPLTLADLQRLAVTNSPNIKQAVHDIQSARGALVQAGLHPNPTVGYESDNVNTALSAGYQGFFVDQVIKTAGKLTLAQDAALMDLLNHEVALRRAQSDLATKVRSGYFAVLVAQENMRVSYGLALLADRTYRAQIEILKLGRAAAYEPLQLQVLALQARVSLVAARNRYISAWKQLAADLGMTALPPTELAGQATMQIPLYAYDAVLAHVLSRHTDVITAQNALAKARTNLQLARVTPIPDVDARVVVQKDYTTPPNALTYGLQLSIPVPVWDRNQGNIFQAEAQVQRAEEEGHRVRDELSKTLADAYERYRTNFTQVDNYRRLILPAQVLAYQSLYIRHKSEPFTPANPLPPPLFGDVVTAQQTLAQTITTYLTALSSLWQAVTDVANVLQTDDLFQLAQPGCIPPTPELALLECDHPCSPLTDPALRGADPYWPDVDPGKASGQTLPADKSQPAAKKL
jgi:cobalt-zinc-cadmium efflux system outer membrane protein